MNPRLPTLLLGIFLALLGLSHWSPQAAWPLQATTTALGGILALAGAGLLAVRKGNARPIARAEFLASVAVVLWAAWWVVRLRDAPVPAIARSDVGTIVQGAVAFLAVATLLALRPRDGGAVPARPVLAGLAVLGAAFGALAIVQVHGPAWMPGTFARQEAHLLANRELFRPNMFDGLLHAVREGRASARLGSPNVFAGLMALAFPATLAFAATAGDRRRVAGWSLAALLQVAGVLLSGSRGGLAALLLGGILFAAMSLRVRMATRLAAAALLALCVLGADGDSPTARRWLGLSTLQQRVHYWEAGRAMWAESPLLGRGPGAFEVLYPIHRVAGSQETRLAHNWIVQWGVETGWVGLALFALWAACATAPAVGAIGRDRAREERLLAAGTVAAVGAGLAHGLVEFTLQFAELHLDFAVLLACAASFATPHARDRLPRWPIALGAALLAVPAWQAFVRKPAVADWERTLAEDAAGASEPEEALVRIERAIGLQPDRADLYAFRAALASDDSSADADMRRACELNPWSAQFIENFAAAQWRRGERPWAIELQRRAQAKHPLDAMHRLRLADYLFQTGERDEARALVESTRTLLVDAEETAERERLEKRLAEP